MTRLEGKQVLVGTQILYTDPRFSVSSDTSPALGTGDGGNPVGFFPGGSGFYSQQISPDLSVGFALAGNFGLAVEYNDDWAGRYYAQKGTLLGISLLPSIAYRVNDQLSLGASFKAMLGVLENQTVVNNITGPDGRLKLEDNEWGWGANVGGLYELSPATRIGLTYSSQVKLDFETNADFSGIAPVLEALLDAKGLLGAPVDLGITVPQTVMASLFHQFDPKWALLANAGWQDWSEFGYVEVGVDSNNPISLTTETAFKDTWHGALGGQYQLSEAWRMNFGIAYDSAFQRGSTVSPLSPANTQWRFGVGGQQQTTKSFHWGAAVEYQWGGTLDVNKQADVPVALGGRGNLVGSYRDVQALFVSANFGWNF
jgi:long-chain fatty acid transport protein